MAYCWLLLYVQRAGFFSDIEVRQYLSETVLGCPAWLGDL